MPSSVEAARERVAKIVASLTAPADDGADLSSLCEGVGLRVVFGSEEGHFEFLCRDTQPYPFVAAATEALLRAGRRSYLDLLDMLGFERAWVQKKIAEGVQFRLVVFALQDAATDWKDDGNAGTVYEPVTPTWDGLLELVKNGGLGLTANARIAEFIEPHIETFKELSSGGPTGWKELQAIAARVDSVSRGVSARVSSFAAFEALLLSEGDDDAMAGLGDVHKARAFLRHTLKCTPLFAGDGFTRTEAGEQGCEERLVRRCCIAHLPSHCWVPLGGGGADGAAGAVLPRGW